MQYGQRGLLPSVSVSIKEVNGNTCTTSSVKQQWWLRNFTRVLNVQSQFDSEEIERLGNNH